MKYVHSTPKESIHFVISRVLKRNDPWNPILGTPKIHIMSATLWVLGKSKSVYFLYELSVFQSFMICFVTFCPEHEQKCLFLTYKTHKAIANKFFVTHLFCGLKPTSPQIKNRWKNQAISHLFICEKGPKPACNTR